VDCILLATPPVAQTTRRQARQAREEKILVAGFAAVAFLVLSGLAAPAFAQAAPDDWTPPPHVRPNPDLRALVDEAARRSPAIRELLERLETLDVIVYIRTRAFAQSDLDGHVGLLAASRGHRYLVIELSFARPGVSQMATLGHELFHAVEIAGEPSIVDARSLAAFYARIGTRTGDWAGRQTFETAAAADAGKRARRELLTNTRSANGS
jgi:hypothetical protein